MIQTGATQEQGGREPRFPRLRNLARKIKDDAESSPPLQTQLTPVAPQGTQPQPPLPQAPPSQLEQPANAFDRSLKNMPIVVSVEAHAGRPYGIGKVTFRLRDGDEMISRTGATWFTEANDRIHYPVISSTPVRRFLEILTGNKSSKTSDLLSIWFLFEGDEPLNARLHGTGVVDFPISVDFTQPKRYERFASNWWKNFNSVSESNIKSSDYPPLVEVYLTSLIGRRLGMNPELHRRRSNDPVMRTFELLFDVEALRLDAIQRSMIVGVDSATPDQPLPEPIEWSPLAVADLPARHRHRTDRQGRPRRVLLSAIRHLG